MRAPCKWTEADADSAYWATDCGKDFTLNDGTPQDNGLRFCCYCGGPLEQVRYVPDDEDEA